jgi:hypothetical protein
MQAMDFVYCLGLDAIVFIVQASSTWKRAFLQARGARQTCIGREITFHPKSIFLGVCPTVCTAGTQNSLQLATAASRAPLQKSHG